MEEQILDPELEAAIASNYTSYERVLRGSKWFKWALLLTCAVSVTWVDWYAGNHRGNSVIAENTRDLRLCWSQTADNLKAVGLESLPLADQEMWDSLDCYVVDAETTVFLSVPRHEPKRADVVAMFVEGYAGRPIDCWTEPVKNARNGLKGVDVSVDYRKVPVVSAYGVTRLRDGKEVVLLVEMDLSEVLAISPANYWDEYIVWTAALICGVVIFFVHREQDKKDRRSERTRQLAERAFRKMHKQDVDRTSEDVLESCEVLLNEYMEGDEDCG